MYDHNPKYGNNFFVDNLDLKYNIARHLVLGGAAGQSSAAVSVVASLSYFI